MKNKYINSLPKRFVKNVIDLCGDEGVNWLDSLPEIITGLEKEWNIEIGNPFSNLSYNFVAPCQYKDVFERVVKIALPLRKPEIFNEATALKAFSKENAAQVLELDNKRRAMLLTRFLPGKSLKERFHERKSDAIMPAIGLLKSLAKPPPKSIDLPKLADWFCAFDLAEESEFPTEIAQKAKELVRQLEAESKSSLLLHGDFHHENILSDGEEGFRVIDPKGIIGDIGYEIAVFLNNHLEWIDDEGEIAAAVRAFSNAFDVSPDNLKDWAFVQRVLSVCWGFEDSTGDWQTYLKGTKAWEV